MLLGLELEFARARDDFVGLGGRRWTEKKPESGRAVGGGGDAAAAEVADSKSERVF